MYTRKKLNGFSHFFQKVTIPNSNIMQVFFCCHLDEYGLEIMTNPTKIQQVEASVKSELEHVSLKHSHLQDFFGNPTNIRSVS